MPGREGSREAVPAGGPEADGSRPVVCLEDVSKTFRARRGAGPAGDVHAVRNVSVEVGPAEIVSLVGGSGAGKSTVGRIVLGLERPETGEVWFENADLCRESGRSLRKLRRRMHLIMQDPYESLHPGMRAKDIVAEPLDIAGTDRDSRRDLVERALDEVELDPPRRYLDRFPHELSGGQRQRVALARALVGRPSLIVADEPTSMLDVSLRAEILDLMLRMRDQHDIAFLFITHDLAMARHVSERIAVMCEGELVESGPSDQVIQNPSHPYTQTLLNAVENLEAPPLGGDKEDRWNGKT